jgi:hypothetical protein
MSNLHYTTEFNLTKPYQIRDVHLISPVTFVEGCIYKVYTISTRKTVSELTERSVKKSYAYTNTHTQTYTFTPWHTHRLFCLQVLYFKPAFFVPRSDLAGRSHLKLRRLFCRWRMPHITSFQLMWEGTVLKISLNVLTTSVVPLSSVLLKTLYPNGKFNLKKKMFCAIQFQADVYHFMVDGRS